MKEIKTVEEWNEVTLKSNSETLIVVDFWAPWCGPCKTFAPTFEEVSTEYPDVIFCKLNVDDVGEVSQTYGIFSIPTTLFIKNNKVIGKQTGTSSVSTLSQKVKDFKTN